MTNLANAVRQIHTDILLYREYMAKMPAFMQEEISNSPLNIERRVSVLTYHLLPEDAYKDISWLNWEFPNEEYASIEDFITQHNLESK